MQKGFAHFVPEFLRAFSYPDDHIHNPRCFKVFRVHLTKGLQYLSFKKYIPIMGDLKPCFTDDIKKARILTNWQLYELKVCCPEFHLKHNKEFNKLYIPNILAV